MEITAVERTLHKLEVVTGRRANGDRLVGMNRAVLRIARAQLDFPAQS